MYAVVMSLHTYCMGLSMTAVEPGFEESLCQALSGINLENVSLHAEQKQAIRNIIFLKQTLNNKILNRGTGWRHY